MSKQTDDRPSSLNRRVVHRRVSNALDDAWITWDGPMVRIDRDREHRNYTIIDKTAGTGYGDDLKSPFMPATKFGMGLRDGIWAPTASIIDINNKRYTIDEWYNRPTPWKTRLRNLWSRIRRATPHQIRWRRNALRRRIGKPPDDSQLFR